MKPNILPRYLLLAALVLIAVASALLHQRALKGGYSHPDEEIARAVVTKVLATKSKDTNWVRTDVTQMFHYNQFNFSSYYLAAAKIEKLLGRRAQDLGDGGILIEHLRKQNVWLGGLSVFLAGLLALRLAGQRPLAPLAGIAAALLTACCVTLFQDDIYARPEAFVTALTLVYVLVLSGEKMGNGPILALSGLIVGALLATKITFAMFLPFPLLVVAARAYADGAVYSHPWRTCAAVALYCAGIGAGFGIGAPYALKAPWEYLEGIGVLLRTYNGDGWHQGLSDAGPIARLAHGVAYLVYTQGAVVLILAAVSIYVLVRERRHAVLLALAGPLLTLLYFLLIRTFFERNFSHALPMIFALAGMGCVVVVAALVPRIKQAWLDAPVARTAITTALIALAIYPGYAVSALLFDTILSQADFEKHIREVRERIAEKNTSPVLFGYSDFSHIDKLRNGLCGKVIYQMLDFGDEPALLPRMAERGYRLEHVLHGPFDGAPFSTLQSYHSSNVVFLHSPPEAQAQSCPAEIVVPPIDPAYQQIDAKTEMTSSWTQNGYPPDMSLNGWPYPFYASWSGDDAKTGDFSIGPFEACGDVIVPYAIGPVRGHTELKIERTIGDSHELIAGGPPPPSLSWAAIRIVAAKSCASYTIHASDHGSGWGEWIGVGMPVELPAEGSPAPTYTDARRQGPNTPARIESADAGRSRTAPSVRCAQKNCNTKH